MPGRTRIAEPVHADETTMEAEIALASQFHGSLNGNARQGFPHDSLLVRGILFLE